MKKCLLLLALFISYQNLYAQNSLVGDGFGGRLWYKPYNYTVGSYSGYTICGNDNQLYGWGSNRSGQLGVNTIASSIEPIIIPDMNNISLYSTGYMMGAIKKDSTGWIWGVSGVPTKVIDDVYFVDAGIEVCAFVKYDGTVWSVGRNLHGQFGNGTTSSFGIMHMVPEQMKNITNAVRTAQGSYTTIVLLKDSTVVSCGKGHPLGAGGGQFATSTTPIPVVGLSEIVDIKAATFYNIALDKNGEVWSWGEPVSYGSALGLPQASGDTSSIPLKIPGLKDIVAISGCNDGFHFFALDKNKNCYAWGNNSSGQCGNGTLTHIYEPQLVATDVVDIMAGEWFSYIVKSDGSLWSTGYGGPIWLNLPRQTRLSFTKIDPTVEGIELCKPTEHGDTSVITPPNTDSTHIPSEVVVIFPNAFSPNGDGKNDLFRAIQKPNALLETFKMEIYNRWGQRVFFTEDVQRGWDGTFEGSFQPISTYYYHVKFRTPNRKPLYIKGDLTLVR